MNAQNNPSKSNRQEGKDRQGKESLGMPSWSGAFLAFPRMLTVNIAAYASQVALLAQTADQ